MFFLTHALNDTGLFNVFGESGTCSAAAPQIGISMTKSFLTTYFVVLVALVMQEVLAAVIDLFFLS